MNKVKLGEVIEVKHGWPFKGEFFSNSGSVIVLTPANFFEQGGFKATPGKEKFYLGEYPSEYLLKQGDLIVAMTEQSAGLLGSTAIVPCDGSYLHNQRIGLVSAKTEEIDLRYIGHLLNCPYVRRQIEASSSGSKVKHTSPEKLYNVEALIPNIKEQRAIASLLGAIDDKIALNKKLCTELEETAQLIYDYWFTQFDFPDEDGNPYRSSGGKMVYNETLKREIPEGWGAGTIDQLGAIESGATPSTKDEQNWNGDIAWITPNDLSDTNGFSFISHGERSITQSGLDSCSAVLMPRGTIVISSRAPIGYLAIASNGLCTNQGCKSIVPSKAFGTWFTYFTVKRFMPIIESQGSGTTFKEISGKSLAEIPLPIPDTKFAKSFNGHVSNLMAALEKSQSEAANLTVLRNWLLPVLMNGQVKVG